jgi:hypothetical protein
LFLIESRAIEILEHTRIRRNPEPTFTQHAEVAKRSDGVRVQVDQLTHEVVQDRNEKFAWRKAKPSHKMRFKIDNDGFINCWEF